MNAWVKQKHERMFISRGRAHPGPANNKQMPYH